MRLEAGDGLADLVHDPPARLDIELLREPGQQHGQQVSQLTEEARSQPAQFVGAFGQHQKRKPSPRSRRR